jgi:nucleotide-binding universal stress UspA family protein
MSLEAGIIAWLAIVIVTAVVASFLAHRWGRDPFGWVLLSAAMGPIALAGLIGVHSADRARGREGIASTKGGAIVVACDGSDVSGRLAQHVLAGTSRDQDIVLLAVLPFDAQQAPGGEAEKNAQRMTVGVSDALERDGRSPRVVVRYGQPGEAIVRFADEETASLIVIGRRGSGLTRALLGSVSGHVVQHAKAPVALVT